MLIEAHRLRRWTSINPTVAHFVVSLLGTYTVHFFRLRPQHPMMCLLRCNNNNEGEPLRALHLSSGQPVLQLPHHFTSPVLTCQFSTYTFSILSTPSLLN